MPLFKKIIEENYTLVVWHLTEDEGYFVPYLQEFSFEPKKLSEIHFPQRRLEWMASRYIGWQIAKELQGNCEGIWSDSHNKPHFMNSPMQISISHSNPYVAVLVHKKHPCGVDIEEKRDKLIRLAPKFLTETELALSNGDLDKLALAWGAKEAIYKMYGRKQLVFKENILLTELDAHWDKGKMNSILRIDNKNQIVPLEFEKFHNHILIYTI
ncbi:MAG: 4'-phosphopantetheinyl transferase superfamily protein [Cyclobacteriaceae bacterium]|nr:4'-phosphopantetheinyl transferase superfamily protein [Cyclobacteriaceae bacterium]